MVAALHSCALSFVLLWTMLFGSGVVSAFPAQRQLGDKITVPVQATGYDADGNVARETDGKGDTTLSSYLRSTL
jgi:hypothetical protein